MGCHFLLQGDLPDPGIKLVPPALAGGFLTTDPGGKPKQYSTSLEINQHADTETKGKCIQPVKINLTSLSSSAH